MKCGCFSILFTSSRFRARYASLHMIYSDDILTSFPLFSVFLDLAFTHTYSHMKALLLSHINTLSFSYSLSHSYTHPLLSPYFSLSVCLAILCGELCVHVKYDTFPVGREFVDSVCVQRKSEAKYNCAINWGERNGKE